MAPTSSRTRPWLQTNPATGILRFTEGARSLTQKDTLVLVRKDSNTQRPPLIDVSEDSGLVEWGLGVS